MFKIINWPRERAVRFHDRLPDHIRHYLKGRGIPSTFIEDYVLGWNGERITIPIFGREPKEVLGFRYAKSPDDVSDSPAMLSDKNAEPELYGWDTLVRKPKRLVIADGEFDRLILEANGFPSVTSTAGPDVFLADWVPYLEDVKHVWICFRQTSSAAAKRVKALFPAAYIVELPIDAEDVTDFFVRLGRTRVDFEILLATAAARDNDQDSDPPVMIREFRPFRRALKKRAEKAKKAVRLHEIVSEDTDLRAEGGRLVGHCPFHDDRLRSFSVYPKTDTYYCSGCEAQGDVVAFLMNKESLTYAQALDYLERFAFTHELYAAS
jgi:hypothetical protein